MPVPSRTNKADAKFNVTTEFPHLGLHSAAATGNVGLVGYALSHGQPVNSVLDGVLPLHAACSGGSNLVVKLLIQRGADVNAPRLPRRYSNDKNRDASAPIVGTSGSTPLHFAAANGHLDVISTLLEHGANPDRADKHGVTPEILARQNGWTECADLLRDWVSPSKEGEDAKDVDKDGQKSQERAAALSDSEGVGNKRLRVKRSIESTLHLLKYSVNNLSEANLPRSRPLGTSASQGMTEPSSPNPFGEYTFYPVGPHSSDDISSSRRPSLPHIFENSVRSSKPQSSRGTSRRPRSAGNGAESQSTPTRKLSTKYSLLNLFKKAGDTSSSPTPEHSFSASPSPGTGTSTPPLSPHQVPQALPSDQSKSRSRAGNDATNPLSAVDLHNALSIQSSMERSVSGFSSGEDGGGSPSTRPGILRAHGRSSSSQSSIPRPQSPYRALRFDSSSSILSQYTSKSRSGRRVELRQNSSPARGLRSESASSLRSNGAPESSGTQQPEMEAVTESAPPETQSFDHSSHIDMDEEEDEEEEEEEEEEEYGRPIPKSVESRSNHRPTTQTLTSSPSALSPILSAKPTPIEAEFPFSINQPPPEDDTEHLSIPRPPFQSYDSRPRGHSVSTMSSEGSVNLPLSLSGTTANSSNGSSFHSLPGSRSSMSTAKPDDFESTFEGTYTQEEGIIVPSTEISTGLSERRAHAPLDINIRSISSHAQAEALVQQAQQDILNMSAEQGGITSPGWTPLSARLAAYGESLALERRLKKEEEEKKAAAERSGSDLVMDDLKASSRGTSRTSRPGGRGLERKLSLEHQPKMFRSARNEPSRPNTSGGAPNDSLSIGRSTSIPVERVAHTHPHHHFSHSASATIFRPKNPTSPTIAVTPDVDSSNSSSSSEDQHVPSNSQLSPRDARHPRRSVTPDPGKMDVFKPYVELPPLTRVSTAPHDTTPAKDKHELARQGDNKLSKTPGGWRPSTASPLPTAGHKSRFGHLKSIVQSLKGKP